MQPDYRAPPTDLTALGSRKANQDAGRKQTMLHKAKEVYQKQKTAAMQDSRSQHASPGATLAPSEQHGSNGRPTQLVVTRESVAKAGKAAAATNAANAASIPHIENLAQEIQAAPRFGLNAKALILMAAATASQNPTNAAAGSSREAIKKQQAPGRQAAPQAAAPQWKAAELSSLVPIKEQPFVTYVPRSNIPRLVRQNGVQTLLGMYLLSVLQTLRVPDTALGTRMVREDAELRAAACQAAAAHEMQLYKKVTSKQAYGQLLASSRCQDDMLPAQLLGSVRTRHAAAIAAAAAAAAAGSRGSCIAAKQAGSLARLAEGGGQTSASGSQGSRLMQLPSQSHTNDLIDELFGEHAATDMDGSAGQHEAERKLQGVPAGSFSKLGKKRGRRALEEDLFGDASDCEDQGSEELDLDENDDAGKLQEAAASVGFCLGVGVDSREGQQQAGIAAQQQQQQQRVDMEVEEQEPLIWECSDTEELMEQGAASSTQCMHAHPGVAVASSAGVAGASSAGVAGASSAVEAVWRDGAMPTAGASVDVADAERSELHAVEARGQRNLNNVDSESAAGGTAHGGDGTSAEAHQPGSTHGESHAAAADKHAQHAIATTTAAAAAGAATTVAAAPNGKATAEAEGAGAEGVLVEARGLEAGGTTAGQGRAPVAQAHVEECKSSLGILAGKVEGGSTGSEEKGNWQLQLPVEQSMIGADVGEGVAGPEQAACSAKGMEPCVSHGASASVVGTSKVASLEAKLVPAHAERELLQQQQSGGSDVAGSSKGISKAKLVPAHAKKEQQQQQQQSGGSDAGGCSQGVSRAQQQVTDFIKAVLQPMYSARLITKEIYKAVVSNAVDKIMERHVRVARNQQCSEQGPGAGGTLREAEPSTDFLIEEAESIRRFISKLVMYEKGLRAGCQE